MKSEDTDIAALQVIFAYGTFMKFIVMKSTRQSFCPQLLCFVLLLTIINKNMVQCVFGYGLVQSSAVISQTGVSYAQFFD